MHNDQVISSLRTQSEELRNLLSQIESDLAWRDNSAFYAERLHKVEWNLRKLRKKRIRRQEFGLTGAFSL